MASANSGFAKWLVYFFSDENVPNRNFNIFTINN